MWGGGYAGLLWNPSGKWCGIIGLGVIQGKAGGCCAAQREQAPSPQKLSATKALATAPTAVLATVSGLGWVSRTPAVSVC